MTALSAAYEAERQDGDIIEVPVLASATIYKGAIVVDVDTGYASAGDDGSGYLFLGVAVEGADNSSGVDGAKDVRVYKNGTFKFTMSGGATQTNLGTTVYITDDQTVASSTTNSVAAGTVVKVIDSTYVKVRIDNSTK